VDVAVAWEDGSGVLTWGRGGGGWGGKRGARENDGLRTLDGKVCEGLIRSNCGE
jgi:hypothetical protein